jgi:hypothetical protein
VLRGVVRAKDWVGAGLALGGHVRPAPSACGSADLGVEQEGPAVLRGRPGGGAAGAPVHAGQTWAWSRADLGAEQQGWQACWAAEGQLRTRRGG